MNTLYILYHSVPGKHPCTIFQRVNVAASIQMCNMGKRPCGPKLCVMFKPPWAPRTLR